MACGRLKNLEIAAGNLLCGRCKRRRNFLTTGNGTRRGGNPKPSAKRKLRAVAEGKLRATGQGENAELRRRGNPSSRRSENSSATRHKGSRTRRRRGNPEPVAKRKLRATGEGRPWAFGSEKSFTTRRKATPGHRPGAVWSHPAAGKPGATAR